MQSKSRIKIISYGLLLIILAGCNLPSTSTTAPSTAAPTAQQPTPGLNPSGSCDNPLFPVKQNATWTYINSGGSDGTFSYTDTITNVRPDGFTVTSQFGKATHTQEWACKPEGLQLTQFGDSLAMALSTQGVSADLSMSDVTGITLPANITPGMQWNYSFNLQGTITYEGQQANANGTVTTDLQEAGSESITVPAGTFSATKIQATSNFDLTAKYLGFDVPVGYSTTSTFWYAPAVGLVKLTETGSFEGKSYTLTSELQSYTIP